MSTLCYATPTGDTSVRGNRIGEKRRRGRAPRRPLRPPPDALVCPDPWMRPIDVTRPITLEILNSPILSGVDPAVSVLVHERVPLLVQQLLEQRRALDGSGGTGLCAAHAGLLERRVRHVRIGDRRQAP